MSERIRTGSSKWFPIFVLFGIALFPVAILQMRETFAPFVSEAPLLRVHKTPIPLQPFTFLDSSGRLLGLSDFKGQHVLVNVWATWCPPCRKEMPALDRLQTKLGTTPEPQILAISVDAISFDHYIFFIVCVISSRTAAAAAACARTGKNKRPPDARTNLRRGAF